MRESHEPIKIDAACTELLITYTLELYLQGIDDVETAISALSILMRMPRPATPGIQVLGGAKSDSKGVDHG